MKKGFIGLILAIVCFLALNYEGKKPKGFSPDRILHNEAFDPSWEMRPLTTGEASTATEALGQTYRFYNRGGQCAVFFSEDGRYVLKFFMKRLYTVPLWLDKFPFLSAYRKKKRAKKKDKLERDFLSYQIAFEELPEETASVYVHLNPTSDLPSLHVIDHRDHSHTIDLNTTPFILQKRAALIPDLILSLLASNDREGVKRVIDQLIQLISTCSQKGIYDRDPSLFTNCGWIGENPVKIDTGSFIRKESIDAKEEMLRIATPLRALLQACDPDLCAYLDTQCELMP